MKLGSVIVTYNPTINIKNIIDILIDDKNLNEIVIVDNSEENYKILKQISCYDKVKIIYNKKNLGIAKALNIGIDYLSKKKINWILTMDQDSKIKKNLLCKYNEFLENNKTNDIALIGTNYEDINTGKRAFDDYRYIFEVEQVISSATLLNVDLFLKLGKFKEYYFIDQVDNEYCYRVRQKLYKIVIINGIDMIHSMGNIKKIKFLNFYTYNQAPIRTYYRTRNKIFICNEYKERFIVKQIIISLIKDFIKISFENNKVKKYSFFIKGIRDGIRGIY